MMLPVLPFINNNTYLIFYTLGRYLYDKHHESITDSTYS